jgi:hypothetical protein
VKIQASFAMHDADTRAATAAALQSSSYPCSIVDDRGSLLIVEHQACEAAAVRYIIYRADTDAVTAVDQPTCT